MVAALSVPKEFFPGIPQHFESQISTTPGQLQTLLTLTNADGVSVDLYQAIVVCEFSGIILVTLNTKIIGSGRTGPGEKQCIIPWTPPYRTQQDDIVVVTFQQRANSPSVLVEAYLSTAQLTLF
jgi:hypothetical protein